MPYRRLPNTDKARLRALKNALKSAKSSTFENLAISYKSIHEAETFLTIFERQLQAYQQSYKTQINANKKYLQIVSNARMYISHFIQVLNLAVIRGEIKIEHKDFYGLSQDNHSVPSLSSEASIFEWGKHIIDGENERTRNGGSPIYSPTIAKVQVHYEIFKEYKANQKLYQATTSRMLEEVVSLREKGDKIILDLWNQIEDFYKDNPPYTKLQNCKAYGITYYYRKHEKELTPEDDNVTPVEL